MIWVSRWVEDMPREVEQLRSGHLSEGGATQVAAEGRRVTAVHIPKLEQTNFILLALLLAAV